VPTLPPQKKEKDTSVRKELENQQKAIHLGFVTPGSEAWEAAHETIVRLEEMLAERHASAKDSEGSPAA
jgi:hypothetical protein